jgi:hypothetical protein
VDFVRQNSDLQPGFPITDAMLDSFYRTLQDEGLIQVERESFDASRQFVSRRLAYEISVPSSAGRKAGSG